MRRRRRGSLPGLAALALAAGLLTGANAGGRAASGRLFDAAAWEAVPADGVEMRISADRGPGNAPALRLDYDFHGRGGWAAARRRIELELPADYELRFSLRGEGPPNHLEVKLVDPSGENVWWNVRRDVVWPAAWTPVRIRKRQVSFAWGPQGGGELRRTGALEFAITAGSGGKGTVWLAELELVPRLPPQATPGPPRASATAAAKGFAAMNAIDGRRETTWRPGAAGAELTLDLGAPRELGGLTFFWESGRAPRSVSVELSDDGKSWRPGREIERGGAERSDLLLTESEARYLRLRLGKGSAGSGLAEIVVQPLEFGASPSAFFSALGREAPRGTYPRGFSYEQVYWTVVGANGDPEEVLFSEDGAIEVAERGFSLEPFVLLGGKLWTWADVTAAQSLEEDELPIPTVSWPLPGARLEITALAPGEAGSSELLVRYRLKNVSPERLQGRLFLAARPFQVNPPQQFLNVAGGVSPLHRLACAGATLKAEGKPRVWTFPPPASCGATAFDEGPIRDRLAQGQVPAASEVADSFGYASAALVWKLDLAPGAEAVVIAGAPFGEAMAGKTAADVAGGAPRFDALLRETSERWSGDLDRVRFDLPPEARKVEQTLRSSLAYILIHRDGPALQPGSRAYARSWIRDGALTGAALLRLGQAGPARDFAEWFAGYQYPDGKVPCCVDRRGADPVPENDSHGELIHLITEIYRYTGDLGFARRLFPHVESAVGYIEKLRQSRRTEEYRTGEKAIFFGLLPESISHEGYSAKPVHSYWDDAFAYRGLADAAELADALGHPELAATWSKRRDEFRADLLASIAATQKRHGISYLPGSAELGDFDSTSTTILLDPGGLEPYLSREALGATFARYEEEVRGRRYGTREWTGYTPYEIRHVGAFVRLNLRKRAQVLLNDYLGERMPPAWNQWPEAVMRERRKPYFLGDLPHGWVASDYIRSALDLFAYERRDKKALVLGAGVPPSWLARAEGVAVSGLATPWGPLTYRLTRRGEGVRYELQPPFTAPPGGLVLTWPFDGRPARARMHGRPAKLAAHGTVVVHGEVDVVDLLGKVDR